MAYLQVGIDSVFETAARIGSTFRDTKGNDSKHFSLYTGQFNRRVYTSIFSFDEYATYSFNNGSLLQWRRNLR